MADEAFRLFCDVDGQQGRGVLPFPHNPHFAPEAKELETRTVAQRLDEVEPYLPPLSLAILKSAIAVNCGSKNFDEVGLFDVLRWWALSGYNTTGMTELTGTFKIRPGQSFFARAFFEEARSTGLLSYAFGTKVTQVRDQQDSVEISTNSGFRVQAQRIICAVPLNVLNDIQFDPPLPSEKVEAAKLGHIYQGAKVHFEVDGTSLQSWTGAAFPGKRILNCINDGITPAGGTHIVTFGTTDNSLSTEEDAHRFLDSAAQFQEDLHVKQMVCALCHIVFEKTDRELDMAQLVT